MRSDLYMGPCLNEGNYYLRHLTLIESDGTNDAHTVGIKFLNTD